MWELALVFVVGLLVLGPDKLPVVIRTVSSWMSSLRALTDSIKAEVNHELRSHELHQNLKEAEKKNYTKQLHHGNTYDKDS